MQQINQFGQKLGIEIHDWTDRSRPEKQLLQGQYCLLEKMDINKHAEQLFHALAYNNQGESWTYLPYGPFASVEDFQAWLSLKLSSEEILYSIISKKNLSPIGISGYLKISPSLGSIEIGHLHFSTLLKRTPLATEAIYLMLQYVFDELGYRRCEWKCNSLNDASIAAAKRFGFQFEGIFRNYGVFKGRNRDTAWFSIIDTEWPALKIRYQKWLDAANFDEHGRQIRKLGDFLNDDINETI